MRAILLLGIIVSATNQGFAQKKADPAASKMLADARAARAVWLDFPGFEANIAVNVNGEVVRGDITVTKKANITLKLPKNNFGNFPRQQLESLVSHRLFSGSVRYTPCAFGDKTAHHPLGRLLLVLNDELHSSYRVRAKQIIEVNRTTPRIRFTITVMENFVNAEKKFLPKTYSVNTWDTKTGKLIRSRTHHNTWKRIGKFDLPSQITIVTATSAGLETVQLTLSNHRLSKK